MNKFCWMLTLFCAIFHVGISAAGTQPAAAVSNAEHQAAITKVLIEHRSAVMTLNLKKMLTVCSKDYRETAWNGKIQTYDDFLKIAKAFDAIRNSDDLETVVENAMIIQNEVISDRQREHAASLKKTAKAREIIDTVRKNLDTMITAGSASARYIRIRDIRIDGEKASAVCELQMPDGSAGYRRDCSLILHRGQWLVQQVR